MFLICDVMFYVDLQVKYTEEYEQSKGKGSFPAMITPGYEMAKKANTLASNVSKTVLLQKSAVSFLPGPVWVFYSLLFYLVGV